MAVYLGSSGIIQLTRVSDEVFRSTLDAGDVDVDERRFSFDFKNGTFVTGDRIKIARLDADGTLSTLPLDFVVGFSSPDGAWFANVDPLGGIRLYSTWADALEGGKSKAIELKLPAATYDIAAGIEDGVPHCLGQIVGYTVTTERASIDVTSLGDQFIEQISGLISGGGSITCYWDWRPASCGRISGTEELPNYLHQLILRQQLGSEFKASLFIKQKDATPIDEDIPLLAQKTALYYQVQGVVTRVALSFESAEALRSEIDFVTTGEIAMRYDSPVSGLILQEDTGRLELEDVAGYLEQELV